MKEKKNVQIPEAVIKMVEQLSEKLGASVKVEALNAAKSGGAIAGVMKLPRVVTDMYLLAQMIDEESNKEVASDVDLLTIIALTQGILAVARDGMPDGYFEKIEKYPEINERKAHFLKVAKDTVNEVTDACDCPKCQANRASAKNKTVH